jgi:hypothetical protein
MTSLGRGKKDFHFYPQVTSTSDAESSHQGRPVLALRYCRRTNSGSLAKFTTSRGASSLVRSFSR